MDVIAVDPRPRGAGGTLADERIGGAGEGCQW